MTTRPKRLHRHQCVGVDCAHDAFGYPMCWLDDDITDDVAVNRLKADIRIGGIPQQVQLTADYPELPDGMTVIDRHYKTWMRHGPFWYLTKGRGKPLNWRDLNDIRGPLRGRILVPVREHGEAA